MTVETTSQPFCDCEPDEATVPDIAFAIHVSTPEQFRELNRCQSDDENHGHDLEWAETHEQDLNDSLAALGHFLDDNPTHTWDRDIRSTIVNPHWRELRNKWNISLNETGQLLGVDSSAVSRWETGKRTPDSTQTNYRDFLAKLWGNLIALIRYRIYTKASIRDAWPHNPQGPEQEAMWDEFWRVGGYFDQWRTTGTLPNTNRWGQVRTEEPAAVS